MKMTPEAELEALKVEVHTLIRVLEHPALREALMPALLSYKGPSIDMIRLKRMTGYTE
jgi:hypothetical protein